MRSDFSKTFFVQIVSHPDLYDFNSDVPKRRPLWIALLVQSCIDMSGFYNRVFYDASRDNGFWSPSTAIANFCELDYDCTYYIGEFVNTISSLAYVYFAFYPPLFSLSRHSRNYDDAARREGPWNGIIWDVHTFALIAVGLASATYHLTLLAVPQFFDESSMYLLAAGFCFDLLTTSFQYTKAKVPAGPAQLPARDKISVTIIKHDRFVIGATISSVISGTSLFTFITGDLSIHSIAFSLLLALSGIRLISMILSLSAEYSQRDLKLRRRLFFRLVRATCLLELGFGLWLIDNNPAYCDILRDFRKWLVGTLREATLLLGMPAVIGESLGRSLGWFTELHGWWHVLTARAAGEYVDLIRWLTTSSRAPKELPLYMEGTNSTPSTMKKEI